MSARAPLLLAAALALTPALAMAAPPTWVVDKAASRLTFASSVSGQAFTGRFARWDAAIHFDPKDPAHSDVAATIDITSASTGNGDRDAEIPDQDWFWTSHFPRASYVARSFQAAGPGRYVAVGVLTIRGVAKPLNLPFALAINGAAAHMTGAITLNRLAFGVGQGEWAATDTVPANATVNIDLTAHRTP
ncbi:MAG TPA: YceI family protein [Caulobacteraceae bacterium]|nr:YceI family protein [Caulobacteraceae bacterium]